MAPKTTLASDESVIREAKANLQRCPETVGGRLYLTDRRLIFEAHVANVQRGATAIELADVTGTAKAWTKFVGLIPLAPNTLVVRTRDGEHRIVVSERDQWIDAIDAQRRG